MARITIRDLQSSTELDQKAMAAIRGAGVFGPIDGLRNLGAKAHQADYFASLRAPAPPLGSAMLGAFGVDRHN